VTDVKSESSIHLDRLARFAETTADQLHEAIKAVRELRDRSLSLIEEMGGDNEFNWSLQADMGYAENMLFSTAFKARQIARHARTPREDSL
jgi:hypothetical protein